MEILGPVLDPLSGGLAYAQAGASITRLGPGSFASVSGAPIRASACFAWR